MAEIAKWPTEEILRRLNENDVPNAPLLRPGTLENEQIVASKAIERTLYDGFGEVRQARPRRTWLWKPQCDCRAGAKLGEHSGAILRGLGYNEEQIQALFDAGVIVGSKPERSALALRPIEFWGAPIPPRTLRPLWVAEELGLAYQLHPIAPRSGETQTDAFTRLNPKQKIPCMVDGNVPGDTRSDGEASQSDAI